MPFYQTSYNRGLAEEQRVLPVIRTYFERDIQKINGRFSQHDFVCPDYTYELKSRTTKRYAFVDTVVGIDKFDNLSKPLILLFSFSDCLCYIEYNPDTFKDYKKTLFGRLDRSVEEAKIHIHIPIKDLIKIVDWE